MSSNKKKSSSSTLKQGTLFSFFAKKPKASSVSKGPPSSAKAPAVLSSSSTKSPIASQVSTTSSSTSATTSNTDQTKPRNIKWKKVTLNCRVGVYWPDDQKYYEAIVLKQRGSSSNFFLEYEDDQTTEWIDLSTEDFKILPTNGAEAEEKKGGNKRRRIAEDDDDEEEFEFDDEVDDDSSDDDDGSVYDPKSNAKDKDDELEIDDSDDDGDDDHMITDEDDEEISRPKKKKAKKSNYKITPLTPKPSSSCVKATPSGSFTSSLSQFANTVTPTQSTTGNLSQSTPGTKSSGSMISSPVLANSKNAKSFSTPVGRNIGKALPYVKGEINERGAHVHNHLKFLRDPKDVSGKRPGEPGYDPRTLKVNRQEWDSHCGKMSPGVKQWWDIKSQYFDTVLLFKTGKFYEMFHMDADIGKSEVCPLRQFFFTSSTTDEILTKWIPFVYCRSGCVGIQLHERARCSCRLSRSILWLVCR